MDEKNNSNFIESIIEKDIASGQIDLFTRFPPEPNGYLHIGHAKSIFLNFGLAEKYAGKCYLRFDDTNPSKENLEYVHAIEEDVRWLGCQWSGGIKFASDYFPQFYDMAISLIKKGLAYVDHQDANQIRETRGTLTSPGVESRFRNRSIEENLHDFEEMRLGNFPDGSVVLRAKIDMSSPNINMRDPVIYRVIHASHHRTGDIWCIYPMYDYAHPLEDAIEGITHSICTLEFEDHRPLYDWFIDHLSDHPAIQSKPRQIEFARLEIENTITSKRKLKQLVDADLVEGWDDPRMPTISGLRRRGFTPYALKDFCSRIGVAKTNSVVEQHYLTHCLREHLNQVAPRAMVVLNPLKLTIVNYPEDSIEWLDAEINPNMKELGTYKLPFGKHIYIEQDDFREEANKKYHRLKPDREVRLKYGYIVKCVDYIKNEQTGEIVEVLCTYDPFTKSGSQESERKVKGTIHWLETTHALNASVRLFDELLDKNAIESQDILQKFNQESLKCIRGCKIEERLADAVAGQSYQFLRKGYFCIDDKLTNENEIVFNETVSLKDGFKG